ncbi:hypothetical protein ANCCAN_12806 [Ancylostoma caninum]|uniref:Uncharacterized protein n=1 Tax=Ancylostoma caninum TaxID=29170 RepID=A0A368GD99_ANCCA|nr:hypothetical protein ANCCAN_12806 [Ancylostoma caninum]
MTVTCRFPHLVDVFTFCQLEQRILEGFT